ncbi:MAG: hypothetical protein WD075_11460 [Rhodospirillales bacterium]
MTVVIKKQMGITHSEFLRLLPRALDSEAFEVAGSRIRYDIAGTKNLEIDLGPESVRQIALMQMPTMPVTLTFSGFSYAEREDLMQRFERAYQRGGG